MGLGFWLNRSFVVNCQTFRSIVAIAIDLLTSEDCYFLWITAVPLLRRCLQSRHSVSRMRGVTLALSGSPNLRPESDHHYWIILLFRQHISSPKLYYLPSVRSVVLVQTQLQYISSSWETLYFSASAHTSNPPFLLVGCDSWWRQPRQRNLVAQWLEHPTCPRK